jgi:hypothetical protein
VQPLLLQCTQRRLQGMRQMQLQQRRLLQLQVSILTLRRISRALLLLLLPLLAKVVMRTKPAGCLLPRQQIQ